MKPDRGRPGDGMEKCGLSDKAVLFPCQVITQLARIDAEKHTLVPAGYKRLHATKSMHLVQARNTLPIEIHCF